VRSLIAHDAEAIVFLGVAIPAELESVRGIGRLRCVSVDRADTAGVTAHTGVDLFGAGRLIAEYLGQLGHRRLAIVAESDSIIGTILTEGLLAQLDTPPAILTVGEGSMADGILQWFALADPPTAAICSSDAIALAVIHACACHEIHVPDRMSIVGFGDSALARCVTPTLTSVRVPAQGAGIAAAEYLLAHFEDHAPVANPLPVKLAVRASTGPRPKG
jgi:DNA-binding LacI/PurR family transcriptional regulator